MSNQYIWQDKEWPNMHWDSNALCLLLSEVNSLRGCLYGRLTALGIDMQGLSLLASLTQEIADSSEIEGEQLNRDSVRSSVARQLGLEYNGLPHPNHYVEGVVQVMLDATQNFRMPLTPERLFGWHAALFPTGYSGPYKIAVAQWRQVDEPMQVVSGPLGRQRVHFQAPPSSQVAPMMGKLIDWVNDETLPIDSLVKAAVAHLWFVTIHPFDDGNGRIARTLTEYMLSKADGSPLRFYNHSSVLLLHRNDYYRRLEHAQHGGLDITQWVEWFLLSLKESLTQALGKTDNVLRKTAFWDRHRETPINERQRKVINMLFDGFSGKLNTSKWYKINHCSQDTALRDIHDLIDKGILRTSTEGGRSTNYELCE